MARKSEQERALAKHRARLYATIWRWHFWSGLIITPVLIVVSLTGALYVFKHELEAVMNPAMYSVQPAPQRAGFEDFRAAFEAQHPDYDLRFINVSGDATRPWEGIAQPRADASVEGTLMTYFDPGHNKLLGSHRRDEGFFAVVLELHRNLMAGWTGRVLVEAMTCWCIVSVIAGLYLWWPRQREKWRGVWVPRISGNTTRILRDWHTVPGMYLSVVTLLVLLSGLLFAPLWGGAWQGINFLTNGFPEFLLQPPESAKPAADAIAIGGDKAFGIANQHFDFQRAAYSVDLPAHGSAGAYQFITDTESVLFGKAVIFIDQFNGSVLLFATGADIPLRTHLTMLFYPVHVGSIFGMPTKILAVLSCLLLIAMAVTGVWMWWRRRRPGTWGMPAQREKARDPAWLVRLTLGLALFLPTVGITLLLMYLSQWILQKRTSAGVAGTP